VTVGLEGVVVRTTPHSVGLKKNRGGSASDRNVRIRSGASATRTTPRNGGRKKTRDAAAKKRNARKSDAKAGAERPMTLRA
jgi:hypothetical protein